MVSSNWLLSELVASNLSLEIKVSNVWWWKVIVISDWFYLKLLISDCSQETIVSSDWLLGLWRSVIGLW